ncbi:MAG: hypothetical protein U0414_26685 [Polyangiaceae bacterium]
MRRRAFSTLVAAGAALACAAVALTATADLAGDEARATKAREAIFELDLDAAKSTLEGADPSDARLAVERARRALYAGDCELAAGLLSRPPLVDAEETKELGAVARGCVRSTVGAVTVEDSARGVWIRFQDDGDQVLAPFMFEVAARAREVFKDDLGTLLPSPIRIELVRDQYALSAMTGLPVTAARTTGTVAIAKWGRVIMVSPRAAPRGYSYLDTLAHELSHLAQTRASADRAPLWLQEGVARIEESRWRPARPFDNVPSCDGLSALGINQHIGPEIDEIGPSIAMLSSATEAQVTYGKVQSFMRFYIREAGAGALPKLLGALKGGEQSVNAAIEQVSGGSFASWKERWEKAVMASAEVLPDEVRPNADPPKTLGETRKRVRLGELFANRKEADPTLRGVDLLAARKELQAAEGLAPREAVIRARFAETLARLGDEPAAAALVADPADVYANDASWWALRAILIPKETEAASNAALGLDPLDPLVACGTLDGAASPADPDRRALCEAARARPRAGR